MKEIEHVREFLERDMAFMGSRVMMLAAGLNLEQSDQTADIFKFQTIDVATVISAILSIIEEQTAEGFAEAVLESLYLSDKTMKRV